jgi:tripartite-type tricarboxylate transporter receptor subunit TctC
LFNAYIIAFKRGNALMRFARRGFLRLTAASAALSFLRVARAESYPTHPITVIVPFPPGGSTDSAARILADRMGPLLGQPVIVENVGGAGGTIGVGRLARSAPDGYTIDIGQWDTHIGGVIYGPPYDLRTDFESIGLITSNPVVMVARKALPADDLKSLVGWMKANPGQINLANQYAGAMVAAVLFEQLTGQKFQLIPYRGAAPAMTDMLADRVDLLIVQTAIALPHLRAGTIKVLANLSPERSPSVPNIPTSDESGLPGFYLPGWFAFFAPKGTPREIIARLNDAMVRSLADPSVRTKFGELGLDVATTERQTPDYLVSMQKGQIEKWWPLIKAANIQAQ